MNYKQLLNYGRFYELDLKPIKTLKDLNKAKFICFEIPKGIDLYIQVGRMLNLKPIKQIDGLCYKYDTESNGFIPLKFTYREMRGKI